MLFQISYAQIGDLVENFIFLLLGIYLIILSRKSKKSWILWVGIGLIFFKSLQLLLNLFVFKKINF
jgi:hypothetical protein